MKLLCTINYDVRDSLDSGDRKEKIRKVLEDGGLGIVEQYDWVDMVVEK
jgi:hypothetical protein